MYPKIPSLFSYKHQGLPGGSDGKEFACRRPTPVLSLNWEDLLEEGMAQFSLVQSLSCVCLFAIPWTAACQASLLITNSQSLLKLMSIELVMPSNYLILCHPLLLPPPIFPTIRVFSNESVLCIRWPKYWSFSFNISSSNEYSRLISFRMDWLDLLAVQGTLKSLLQHHSSKASVLQLSSFFIVQFSHPYMTTEKTIALTRRIFGGKIMSLFFNMPGINMREWLPSPIFLPGEVHGWGAWQTIVHEVARSQT